MNKQLSQIKALLDTDQADESRAQMEQYLDANPEDAEGWFLASFVQPTPKMRLSAIRRAAALKPHQPEIQKRLTKLQSASTKNRRFPWLPAFIIVLLAGIVVLAVAMISRSVPASDQLPTLAVLQAATDIPTGQVAALTGQNTEQVTLTAILSITPPQATASESFPATPEVTSTRLSIQSTIVAPTDIPSPAVLIPVLIPSQPNNPLPLPTTSSGVTPPTFATLTPTSTTSPAPPETAIPTQPTGIPSTVIPTPAQTVPMGSPVNMAAGQFRVVDATRGAESMIQSLGGTFPPAPANQAWLLVEMLLLCKDSATCAFDPSTLHIAGSSGAVYSYSPQLVLTPLFGSVTQANQIWGYVGFVIPTSETQLKLTVSENGQTYAVALE